MAEYEFRPERSVKGFAREDNISTIRTLESTLQVDFEGSYPVAITLDAKNSARLFLGHPIEFVRDVFRGKTAPVEAAYAPEYDACFFTTREDEDEIEEDVILHETLHAFLARQNRLFALRDPEYIKGFNTEPERFIVLLSCAEGLANLGTIEALQREGKHALAWENEKYYLGENYSFTPESYLATEKMRTGFEKLREGVVAFSYAGTRRLLARSWYNTRAFGQVSEHFYTTGLFFTKFVVSALQQAGMDFGDAYVLLAKNIPTTIDQLEHPWEYAGDLLRTFHPELLTREPSFSTLLFDREGKYRF